MSRVWLRAFFLSFVDSGSVLQSRSPHRSATIRLHSHRGGHAQARLPRTETSRGARFSLRLEIFISSTIALSNSYVPRNREFRTFAQPLAGVVGALRSMSSVFINIEISLSRIVDKR